MSRRLRFSGIHLLASAVVALVGGGVIFLLWYPPPYAALAGGLTLFSMLVGIDVVLGPSLTALVAGPAKPLAELRRDITWIVLLQVLALAYGVYTIASARPVHLVFEVDRFRVVSAADIEPERLEKAPPGMRALPWTGPTVIAARKSATQEEMLRSLELGLQGVDLSMQPDRWTDYAPAAAAVLNAARPVDALLGKHPEVADGAREMAAKHGVSMENLRFLPLVSRSEFWVALVASPDARIVGFLPVDGFF